MQTAAGYSCLHDCSPTARKGKQLVISSYLFYSQGSKVSLALILKYFHPDQNLENQLPKKKPLWPSHSHNWAISKEQPQEKSYENITPSYSAENGLPKCIWIALQSQPSWQILQWILFSLYFINKIVKAPSLQLVAGRHTALLTHNIVCKEAHLHGTNSIKGFRSVRSPLNGLQVWILWVLTLAGISVAQRSQLPGKVIRFIPAFQLQDLLFSLARIWVISIKNKLKQS